MGDAVRLCRALGIPPLPPLSPALVKGSYSRRRNLVDARASSPSNCGNPCSFFLPSKFNTSKYFRGKSPLAPPRSAHVVDPQLGTSAVVYIFDYFVLYIYQTFQLIEFNRLSLALKGNWN